MEAPRAAPAIAIQGPPEAVVAQKAAEAKELSRAALQAELVPLKKNVNLIRTADAVKGLSFPAFVDGEAGMKAFKENLRPAVSARLAVKESALTQSQLDVRVEEFVQYTEKNIRIKLLDPILLFHPYTLTVTFDASGEVVLDLKPNPEVERAAKDAAAKETAAKEAPKDPAKETTDAAAELTYQEFAKGSYGGMAKFIFGMLEDPKGESESPEDYNKRLDAKLRATFRGEGMLGMFFCLVGIVPRDGVFYKDMLDKPWAKQIEASVREAFKALGISPEKIKDVVDNQAFQELMKVEKTHEDSFSIKAEVVVPPGIVLTVEKFKVGVFENGVKMDKPGSPGASYDPAKVEEKQTFVAGVKFPPGTMLAGVTVKKQPEVAKSVAAEQPPVAAVATPEG